MKDGAAPSDTGGTQAVARALSLLSLVGRGGAQGLGLAQIAAASGLARPTARRLLLALGAARMVEQDRATRRYHLGPETYLLAGFATERHGILHHARDSMVRLARETGEAALLSFDMGGTTAKVCLIDGYQPQASRTFEVARVGRFKKGSGLPLRIPVIEMVEIGAGGGSIARIEQGSGLMKVGPRSAGADPGPVCYGRGGTEPCVTDADLLLGRLDPGYFLGGEMALDPDRVRRAFAEGVAAAQ